MFRHPRERLGPGWGVNIVGDDPREGQGDGIYSMLWQHMTPVVSGRLL